MDLEVHFFKFARSWMLQFLVISQITTMHEYTEIFAQVCVAFNRTFRVSMSSFFVLFIILGWVSRWSWTSQWDWCRSPAASFLLRDAPCGPSLTWCLWRVGDPGTRSAAGSMLSSGPAWSKRISKRLQLSHPANVTVLPVYVHAQINCDRRGTALLCGWLELYERYFIFNLNRFLLFFQSPQTST